MDQVQDPQLFFHVRIVMGMILGLGVTRLLGGLAKFVQHPAAYRADPLHLGWAATLLLNLLLFWWWEFRLINMLRWTFDIYLFLVLYCSLFYFMFVLLFPDSLGEYGSYRAYFIDKFKWFFGFYALMQVLDLSDGWVTGSEYLHVFGWAYEVETIVTFVWAIVAMFTVNVRVQAAFLVFSLLSHMIWMAWLLRTVT